MSPDKTKVLYLVVDAKQPSRAKLPMEAGFLPGTKLSVGEGADDAGVVGETPPDGPLEGKVFPEGATEPPGPEGVGPGPPPVAKLGTPGPPLVAGRPGVGLIGETGPEL